MNSTPCVSLLPFGLPLASGSLTRFRRSGPPVPVKFNNETLSSSGGEPMNHPYVTTRRLATLAVTMTPRDWLVLSTLGGSAWRHPANWNELASSASAPGGRARCSRR